MIDMKVGLLSDSHGNLGCVSEAAKWLARKGIETVIHLGDNYEDCDHLCKGKVRLIRVPGVYSEYYQNENIANRIVENFNNWRVLITHTDCSHENDSQDDIKPEEAISNRKVDAVFYGHTHIPLVEERNGVLLVNPGHLKPEDKKGYPASFAVVDFKDSMIEVKILNLDSKEEMSSFKFNKK
jgi:putative phosphoesterase